MEQILYLNHAQLESLGLDMPALIDLLEGAFRQQAAGQVQMPPKIFFHTEGDRFCSAMVTASPALGYAGCKWQTGDPHNPERGLPYIQGLYLLNDAETGRMLAIMDARWITGRRTAAASALVARYQARAGARRLAILGCGLQGRAHLEALAAEVGSLEQCTVFDIAPAVQKQFIDELDGQFNGLAVAGAPSAREAIREADIVITGGPIQTRRAATIQPEWIAPGALVVTIDYDSYVTDACIEAMDIVMTDDIAQLQEAQRTEGKFTGVARLDTDIPRLIASGQGRRTGPGQRILSFNLGVALEDLATAAECLERARARGIGVTLTL
ncbi:MAG: hypothetical protein GTN86_11875 [Xanthomonadales bacterium]|nr:hypothetical protein [Xanthomonadales bacterium]NIN60412.1 hypothetical protein [Xanthomonadales bacterium]NIN75765.1 hypothetical protein [Xanthomonadales bacterium]NIO12943.1 hypothetical protein [Xanthomonadales bacterium]NIP12805.1 hypothetical protein [Xanthomonadales bacterium]